MGNTLYFTAVDGTQGTYDSQLWKSDGTEVGTEIVKIINPSGTAGINGITVMDNYLYFGANDGTNDKQLWKSDGTEGGTEIVKIINPNGNANPQYLTVMGNTLYFTAVDGTQGTYDSQLWKSDGTEVGTEIVKIINPSGSTHIMGLTVMDNYLYFGANDGTNYNQLWKSDGIVGGDTAMITPVINTNGNANPGGLEVITKEGVNSLYMGANDAADGDPYNVQLWIYGSGSPPPPPPTPTSSCRVVAPNQRMGCAFAQVPTVGRSNIYFKNMLRISIFQKNHGVRK